MKVLVLNGSPKGKQSITLYTAKYIEKHNPQDTFEYINVAQQIKSLDNTFDSIKEKILKSEIIVFSFPVYTFEVPYQLHHFIDLLHVNFSDELKGKFATCITTSKHFFDMTAHEFIKENCKDFGMNYIDGLSADAADLPTSEGKKQALDYWKYLHFNISLSEKNEYKAKNPLNTFSVKIIADFSNDKDGKLKKMVDDFQMNFPYVTSIFRLDQFPFTNGCLGCLKCASDGQCVYNDGFTDVLRNEILPCDGFVYAFSIKNHSCGDLMKIYDDRQFCNGHRVMTVGKPIGYLIDGDINNEYNVQTMINGKIQVGKNILVDMLTNPDEIKSFSNKLSFILDNKISTPQNYYGVGGSLVFRDLIYIMGGVMKADYKFFKKEGMFNSLPTNHKKEKFLMKLVGFFMSNKKFMKNNSDKITKGMLSMYEKALEE